MILKDEWPSDIRFEDAITHDDKGRRFSRPATTVFPKTGGTWGHTSDRQPVTNDRRSTDARKSHNHYWSKREIALLKWMYEKKYSTGRMVKNLKKFGEQAIRNQLFRLGLSLKERDMKDRVAGHP